MSLMIRATAHATSSGTRSAPVFIDNAGGEMAKKHEKGSMDKSMHGHGTEHSGQRGATHGDDMEPQNENPPRTTSNGWLTTPKFGSSTSGGGEIEPGPERD